MAPRWETKDKNSAKKRGGAVAPGKPSSKNQKRGKQVDGLLGLAGKTTKEKATKLSAAEKQRQNAKEWIPLLDIRSGLEGELLGKPIWGAEQTLLAMKARRNDETAEYILLSSHVQLVKLTKDFVL